MLAARLLRGLLLLLAAAQPRIPRAEAAAYLPGRQAAAPLLAQATPAPSKTHCRVFVAASTDSTRALLVASHDDHEGVAVYGAFPAAPSLFEAADAYSEALQPTLERVAAFLRSGDSATSHLMDVEPRHCHLHILALDLDDHDDDAESAKEKQQRLDELYARQKDDAAFPFRMRREDALVVVPDRARFWQLVGANYLAGHIPVSLGPGSTQMIGVLHASPARAAIAFDLQERWRRNKRLRQATTPLNTTDLFSREFAAFGRDDLARALREDLSVAEDSSTRHHPCLFKGEVLSDAAAKTEGSGHAAECIALLTARVDKANADCPAGGFCMLGGGPQPRPMAPFFASGLARHAVLFAAKVLAAAAETQADGVELPQLQLPSPPLDTIEQAAVAICALPFDQIAKLPATTETFYEDKTLRRSACLDLCYSVVLLKQLGVDASETRVQFVEQFGEQPPPAADGVTLEELAWATGAFLDVEAEQRKASYMLEADLLALQVSEGLPIGWNLSALVLVAACVFLYVNTGARNKTRSGSGGYQRVVNSGKAKYKDTTQSIVFVDDASE